MCATINLTRIVLLFLMAPYFNWNTTVSGMYLNERHLIDLYIIVYFLMHFISHCTVIVYYQVL